jgi:hypothetical protein
MAYYYGSLVVFLSSNTTIQRTRGDIERNPQTFLSKRAPGGVQAFASQPASDPHWKTNLLFVRKVRAVELMGLNQPKAVNHIIVDDDFK